MVWTTKGIRYLSESPTFIRLTRPWLSTKMKLSLVMVEATIAYVSPLGVTSVLGARCSSFFRFSKLPTCFCKSSDEITVPSSSACNGAGLAVVAKVNKASDPFPMSVLDYLFPTEPLNLNQYEKGRYGNGQLTNWRYFPNNRRENRVEISIHSF